MSNHVYDIALKKGDTLVVPIKWVGADDVPHSLLGWGAYFQVRHLYADSDPLVEFTSADHTQIFIPETHNLDATRKGEIIVTVPAAKTSLFPVGVLHYELEVRSATGIVYTILSGSLNILDEALR